MMPLKRHLKQVYSKRLPLPHYTPRAYTLTVAPVSIDNPTLNLMSVLQELSALRTSSLAFISGHHSISISSGDMGFRL